MIVLLSLITLALTGFACLPGGRSPDITSGIILSQDTPQAPPTPPEASEGCLRCHAGILTILPENHFKVAVAEIKNCLVCHSGKGPAAAFTWVIHWDHYSKKEFSGNCWSCHLIDKQGDFKLYKSDRVLIKEKTDKRAVNMLTPFFHSWGSSKYLDQVHAARGVTCTLCHNTLLSETKVSKEQCLQCHGSYQHLSARSKDLLPNPHASHCGEISCTLCHHAHQQSELYCNLCHSFEIKVP